MALAEDLRDVFRTGQRDYTLDEAWERWTGLCEGWGKDYRGIKKMAGDISYKYYFTYLQYHPAIPVDDLHHQLDREAQQGFSPCAQDAPVPCPTEESVLVLMGKVVDGQGGVQQGVTAASTRDETLFPKEEACFTHP